MQPLRVVLKVRVHKEVFAYYFSQYLTATVHGIWALPYQQLKGSRFRGFHKACKVMKQCTRDKNFIMKVKLELAYNYVWFHCSRQSYSFLMRAFIETVWHCRSEVIWLQCQTSFISPSLNPFISRRSTPSRDFPHAALTSDAFKACLRSSSGRLVCMDPAFNKYALASICDELNFSRGHSTYLPPVAPWNGESAVFRSFLWRVHAAYKCFRPWLQSKWASARVFLSQRSSQPSFHSLQAMLKQHLARRCCRWCRRRLGD